MEVKDLESSILEKSGNNIVFVVYKYCYYVNMKKMFQSSIGFVCYFSSF